MEGGIHLSSGHDKALTAEKTIRRYQPDEVRIDGSSFFVTEGETVAKGQKIGMDSFQMPLHASVTGIVREVTREEIEETPKEASKNGLEIVKKGKEKQCVIERCKEEEEPERSSYQKKILDEEEIQSSREEIIQKIKEAGLVGMGGAGFPTYLKYKTEKKISHLLINGAECEPFLTCDDRLMIEEGYAVLNGIFVLKKAADAENVFLCIEENKKNAAQSLKMLLRESKKSSDLEIVLLPTRYPQGGERQLIQTVLGKEVPAGGLPADVGVIVSNVATAKAAADAVLANLPLTERVVTVTGAVESPCNYLVPIGTPIKKLLEACGRVCDKENRIILGGPMTGKCIAVNWDGEELPCVRKTTSGVVAMVVEEQEETPCIRCGACVRICPAGLAPFQIDYAFLDGDERLCEKLYASECIACGCCSYVCPAKRELTERVKNARDLVKQRQRERRK